MYDIMTRWIILFGEMLKFLKKNFFREWSLGKEIRKSVGFRARISILNMEFPKSIDYSIAALKLPLYHSTSIPNRTRRWHGGDIVTVAWNSIPKRTLSSLKNILPQAENLKLPALVKAIAPSLGRHLGDAYLAAKVHLSSRGLKG
jgi:hypothetical protein